MPQDSTAVPPWPIPVCSTSVVATWCAAWIRVLELETAWLRYTAAVADGSFRDGSFLTGIDDESPRRNA